MNRVAAFAETFTPDMLVGYPNRKFVPPVDESVVPPKGVKHLRVFLFRTPTAATAFRTRLVQGFMQLSVYWPFDEGTIKPNEIAGAAVAFFDPQLPWLTFEGVTVRIDPGRPPYKSSPLQDGTAWWHVPVTINWFCQINT